MHDSCVISMMSVLACCAAPALAQQAVEVSGDRERVFPTISLFDQSKIDLDQSAAPLFAPMSAEQLTALRASGADPIWIAQSFAIPQFNPTMRRFSQGDDPLRIESWAVHHNSEQGVALSDSLRFNAARSTDLSDGNIAGSSGGFGANSSSDHIASIAQSEGEYDIYDLSLQWDAVQAGPVRFSLLSGFKAIEANISKRVTDSSGNTSMDSAHRVTAMPMVGSGVNWQISDDFSIRGSATTHPIESGDTLIDFNAATNLRITRNIGFVAGYRIIRSSFDVGDVSTELSQEGLFARLQISF